MNVRHIWSFRGPRGQNLELAGYQVFSYKLCVNGFSGRSLLHGQYRLLSFKNGIHITVTNNLIILFVLWFAYYMTTPYSTVSKALEMKRNSGRRYLASIDMTQSLRSMCYLQAV